jgi:hypothetical protein
LARELLKDENVNLPGNIHLYDPVPRRCGRPTVR